MASRNRRRETICDSSALTIAVVIPVALSLYLYRQEPRKLFQILFGVFVLLMGFIMTRHLWAKLAVSWKRKDEEVDTGSQSSPLRDEVRREAVNKAQEKHNEKADDYERRVAAPRREKKLNELDAKMRSIRGLKDEGTALGGLAKSSRLLQSSHDSHVDESDDDDGDESGVWVTISLRLPDRSVKRKFRTSQKIKSLYTWLHGLGYSSEDYLLTTLIPKTPLTDQTRRLAEVGLGTDTTLAVEERDD